MSIRNLKDGHNKPWFCECYPKATKASDCVKDSQPLTGQKRAAHSGSFR